MNKLYKKNELTFALILIGIYILTASFSDSISARIGVEKSVSVITLGILSGGILVFIKNNSLHGYYALRRPEVAAKEMLYYIPLVFISSCNVWFGIKLNYSALESVLHAVSMLFVGFLEEIIFRGFLFRAMEKDGVKSAVVISSITFGIGHIINLLRGSEFVPTVCQVCYAVVFGFLFCVILLYTKSIIPCIITHSAVNSLSVFSSPAANMHKNIIIVSILLAVVSVIYSAYIVKRMKQKL